MRQATASPRHRRYACSRRCPKTPPTQSRASDSRLANALPGTRERLYTCTPSNTRLTQLNIGIVGDLGTGKTQLTQALIYRLTRSSGQNRDHAPKVLVFDYKRDYTKPEFVEAVGARVINPHRIPLNIFDLHAAGDHTPSARLGRVKFLNDALQKIYGGIGPRQRNHLKTAVMQGYDSTPGGVPTLVDVLRAYEALIGDKIDAPYSILSDLVDLEIFVEQAADARHFDEFFTGVTIIDLASLGIGDKERNMLVVLFLNLYYEYMINLPKRPYAGEDPQLRFVDSMLLVDEADSIMKYNFDVLRQILLQGREFGIGVLLASQYLSHFRTRDNRLLRAAADVVRPQDSQRDPTGARIHRLEQGRAFDRRADQAARHCTNACTRRSMSRGALCELCPSTRLRDDPDSCRGAAYELKPVSQRPPSPYPAQSVQSLQRGARRHPTIISHYRAARQQLQTIDTGATLLVRDEHRQLSTQIDQCNVVRLDALRSISHSVTIPVDPVRWTRSVGPAFSEWRPLIRWRSSPIGLPGPAGSGYQPHPCALGGSIRRA